MRVVSIHPSRDPVACGEGPVYIGSAQGDDIVPAAAGAEPHHVMLAADARGLLLAVKPGCQRVYVNARAVREQALLHYGDTVTLGANKFLVTADSAPPDRPPAEARGGQPGRVGLRIVSGTASGQVLPVAGTLRLGAGTRYFGELAYGYKVTQSDAGLGFESDSASARVNGWRCQAAKLSPGDQIVLGEHRLIVEAPALQYAARVAALPPPPPVEPMTEAQPDDTPHTEIWWLIGAAVVLAAAIALSLYFRW